MNNDYVKLCGIFKIKYEATIFCFNLAVTEKHCKLYFMRWPVGNGNLSTTIITQLEDLI